MGLAISLLLILEPADLLQRAEAAFLEGVSQRDTPSVARERFRESASTYQELEASGIQSPDLYRNLGRARFLAGDLPGAILDFRRGLRLAPADPDLLRALAHARTQVAYARSSRLGRPRPSSLPAWILHLQTRERTFGAGICYAVLWIALVHWLTTRRATPVAVLWLSGAGFVLLAASLIRDELEYRDGHWHPLVVIAEEGVLLRAGNGPSYPARHETPLNRGVEARQLFQRGDWLQVELAGGEVGWVARTQVLVDTP